MRSFEELLKESSSIHGHHCAGQVLGVRMAMVGCREIEIDEPKGCKKLIVYVEMDRCATDAVQAVTGCSLGKRTLKFLDYGKMAVTFVNLETEKAVRVLARDDARSLAPIYSQDVANPRDAQKKAYAVMPEDSLFSIQPVNINISEENMPGFRSARVYCEACGEGINLRREVKLAGRTLCIPCAQSGFLPSRTTKSTPKVLLVVGYKKVGKTTLIERLIPELSRRGYRVGTVKHHHSDFPVAVDSPGTDTWRHRSAGATSVALVSPKDVALFRYTEETLSLDDIISRFPETDIVLVEGFHLEPRAKIEVLSDQNGERLCPVDENVLAVVGAAEHDEPASSFSRDNIKPLVDLIERKVLGLLGDVRTHSEVGSHSESQIRSSSNVN
jgi:molybdopterin-guanine dinucleotide biosynthesis protein MobB